MTLREFLKEKKDEGIEFVKIGAKNGSGFFYAGYIQDFEDRLETFNTQFQNETKAGAERVKTHFIQYTSKFSAQSALKKAPGDDDLNKFAKSRIEEATKSIREEFDMWLSNCARISMEMSDAYKLVNKPVPVMDRQVLDTFMASDIVEDEPTVVAIIYGWENGSFWTIDEAKTKKAKQKKEAA